jgi:hypothetical protein
MGTEAAHSFQACVGGCPDPHTHPVSRSLAIPSAHFPPSSLTGRAWPQDLAALLFKNATRAGWAGEAGLGDLGPAETGVAAAAAAGKAAAKAEWDRGGYTWMCIVRLRPDSGSNTMGGALPRSPELEMIQ